MYMKEMIKIIIFYLKNRLENKKDFLMVIM